MAMTNAMIIFWESADLMEKGILQGTGETVTIEDPEGNEIEMEVPEDIHTYAAWKELGYQVRKGEHAIAKFKIWKHTTKKGEAQDGSEDQSKMFMKLSHFFKASQVDRI